MSDVQAFIDKWQSTELSLRLAANFAPRVEREAWLISMALLFELWESAFALTDERVTRTKLAWWATEAGSALTGNALHPLVQALDVLGSDLSSLPVIVRELTNTLEQATARDLAAQQQMLSHCAAAAADLLLSGPLHRYRNDASRADLQHCLVNTLLIYQLKCLAKADRFGPCALPATVLAGAALRRSQLHEASADATIQQQRDALVANQSKLKNGLAANGALFIAMARSVRRAKPSVGVLIADMFRAWRFARRA